MLGDPGTIGKLAKVAEDTYISPGYVAQAITWEWCRRGLLPPQIERLKKLYAPRLDACLAGIESYMPDAKTTKPDGGFFISLTLPEGVSTTAVRTQAATKGLNLADGLAFFPEGGGERFIRLPFCALSPKEIDDGVKRLSEAVKESQAAPAAYRSWRERRLVEDRMQTFAEGLATRTAFELPQRILWRWLDEFVLVGDNEIRAAQALMIEATRNLIEAAGAAPLAAALRLRQQLASKRIALIASGGNATRDQLLDVLSSTGKDSSRHPGPP